MVDVFREAARWGVFIVECIFYGKFLWIWVAEKVGEVFSGFGGDVCIFYVSDGNSRIDWLVFMVGRCRYWWRS